MRRDDRFISASQIGTWCYCKKAWHLSQRGYLSSLAEERAAGTRYHESHNHDLRGARQQRAAARIVMFLCVLIFILNEIAHLWSR